MVIVVSGSAGFGKSLAFQRKFNVEKNDQDEAHGPWGAAGIPQANRPEPHCIEAVDNPEKQADEIVQLLHETITDKLEELAATKAGEGEQKSSHALFLDFMKELQKQVAATAAPAIEDERRT
jgi:putative ATP-dependent endonuclease of OLD family